MQAIAKLIRQVERGVNFSTLVQFEKASGLPMAAIGELLQIPQRTMARRKAKGRLSAAESERLLRISGLFQKALRLFEGDAPAARVWFTRPKRALGHETPLAYARTEIGAREVEALIERLEHGVFS